VQAVVALDITTRILRARHSEQAVEMEGKFDTIGSGAKRKRKTKAQKDP
jgi:hypothetical protein